MTIRILALSDEASSALYNAQLSDLVGPVDVLLGCGDLPYTYMEHVVTTLNVRDAFFVHGNHDTPQWLNNGRRLESPGGWQNVDGRVGKTTDGALLVAGLEGSIRYQPSAPYQYSERAMASRTWGLVAHLLFNRVRYGRYVDVLIAHSPPLGIHDGPDGAHRGFKVFLSLMRRFRPKLLLHGHKHHYGPGTWRTRYEGTEVVNVHPFRLIELEGTRISFGKLYRR